MSGKTFYEQGCHDELFHPPCNAGRTRYSTPADGGQSMVLFTKPGSRRPRDRTHLRCCVSHDEGRTWIEGNVISEKSGGYSDVAVLRDRTILTVYENRLDDSTPKGLLLARYNLAWVLSKE